MSGIRPFEVVRNESDGEGAVEVAVVLKVKFLLKVRSRLLLPVSPLVLFSIGATVSMDKAMELFASDPSLLKLPAASQNLSDATEAQPLMVLSVEGVKVAE